MVFRGLFFSNYEKSYEKYLLTINSLKSTLHVLIQTLHHWETLFKRITRYLKENESRRRGRWRWRTVNDDAVRDTKRRQNTQKSRSIRLLREFILDLLLKTDIFSAEWFTDKSMGIMHNRDDVHLVLREKGDDDEEEHPKSWHPIMAWNALPSFLYIWEDMEWDMQLKMKKKVQEPQEKRVHF